MPNAHVPNLIVVVGPTAVGKTALCITLAKHWGTAIISADARQCYERLNIGTAKPTAEEQQGVTHHLLDFLPLAQNYSAGMFAQDALQCLAALWRRHDEVIVTGGAGLYIQALCEGLPSIPSVPLAIQTQLKTTYQAQGLAPLIQELSILDPTYLQQVDQHNPHRILRALGVCRTTGRPYTHFRYQPPLKRPFKITKIGLRRPRAALYARIDQRVDRMVEEGLFEEATALIPYSHCQALQTIGYQEVFGFLKGRYDKAEAIRRIKRNTRHYAKRQLTWFTKDPAIRWFHPKEGLAIKTYIAAQALR